jgi:hypothetical protein
VRRSPGGQGAALHVAPPRHFIDLATHTRIRTSRSVPLRYERAAPGELERVDEEARPVP